MSENTKIAEGMQRISVVRETTGFVKGLMIQGVSAGGAVTIYSFDDEAQTLSGGYIEWVHVKTLGDVPMDDSDAYWELVTPALEQCEGRETVSLSDVWDAMTAAGAIVFASFSDDADGEVHYDGTDFVELDGGHVLCVNDTDGYAVMDASAFGDRDGWVVKAFMDDDAE